MIIRRAEGKTFILGSQVRPFPDEISIIIPTRDRYRSVGELIASINGLGYREPFETIIADQSRPKQEITPPAQGEYRYLPMTTTGAAAARNHAVRHAKGDYLLFVDDDAVLEKDSLAAAHELTERYPGHACICGMVTLPDGKRAYSRHTGAAEAPVTFRRFDCCLLASMIVRRSDMIEVGLFDEQLGIGAKYGGSEESDLVLRLLECGKQIVYHPALRVRHPDVDAPQDGACVLGEQALHVRRRAGRDAEEALPRKTVMGAVLFGVVAGATAGGRVRAVAALQGPGRIALRGVRRRANKRVHRLQTLRRGNALYYFPTPPPPPPPPEREAIFFDMHNQPPTLFGRKARREARTEEPSAVGSATPTFPRATAACGNLWLRRAYGNRQVRL